MTKICKHKGGDMKDAYKSIQKWFSEKIKTLNYSDSPKEIMKFIDEYIKKLKVLLVESDCKDKDNILGRLLVVNPGNFLFQYSRKKNRKPKISSISSSILKNSSRTKWKYSQTYTINRLKYSKRDSPKWLWLK